ELSDANGASLGHVDLVKDDTNMGSNRSTADEAEILIVKDGHTFVIDGKGGDDIIIAGAGNSTIYGGDGNDILVGGGGNDTLYGQAGADILIGGEGNDTLHGQGPGDIFRWGTEALNAANADTITGYSIQQGHKIDLQSL